MYIEKAIAQKFELVCYYNDEKSKAFRKLPESQLFTNSAVAELDWAKTSATDLYEWQSRLGDALDDFFDGQNDIYRTPDGRYWEIETIWVDALGGDTPLYWREVKKEEEKMMKKTYICYIDGLACIARHNGEERFALYTGVEPV